MSSRGLNKIANLKYQEQMADVKATAWKVLKRAWLRNRNGNTSPVPATRKRLSIMDAPPELNRRNSKGKNLSTPLSRTMSKSRDTNPLLIRTGSRSQPPLPALDTSVLNHEVATTAPKDARKIRLKFMRQRIEDVADSSSMNEISHKLRHCDIRGLKRDFFHHILGIRERNLVRGIQGSKLIDPFSPFHSSVELFLAVLLVYCAFVVPVQLSFWNSDDPCTTYPTLPFDMFVDFCFMVEVVYDFFVGVTDSAGNYVDSLPSVAWMQMSNPWLFGFNVFTSVPVSWIDYHIAQLCDETGGGANFQSSQNVGLLRAAKPLRLIKLVRLLKASKAYWVLVDYLDVNPAYPRVLKIVCMLSMSMHWCCCILWRLKVETDRELLGRWLADRQLVEADTSGCYILCIYFVCTVFTTVGFGDIYALNTQERLFFMFLMLLAAFLFGTLIGELQELFAAMNKNNREMEEYMDGVISFLTRNKMPRALQRSIKSFVRFKFTFDRSHEKLQQIMAILPPNLRNQMATTLNSGVFAKVRLFRKIRSQTDRAYFSSALLPKLYTATCPRKMVVAHHLEPANRLIIVTAGRIGMFLAKPEYEDPGPKDCLHVLQYGDGFGDASVLGDQRWASAYGVHADFIAMEDAQITYIYTADVLEVVADPLFEPIRACFQQIRADPNARHEYDYGPAAERVARATFLWSQLVQAWTDGGANGLWSPDASVARRVAEARQAEHGPGESGSGSRLMSLGGSFRALRRASGNWQRRNSSLLFPSARRPSLVSVESDGLAEAEAAGSEAEVAEAEFGILANGRFSPLGAHGRIDTSSPLNGDSGAGIRH